MTEFINIIEEAFSKVYTFKVIIRLVVEEHPSFPSLKAVVTDVNVWNGHKTVMIYHSKLKGKDIEQLKKQGLLDLLADVINGKFSNILVE